MPTPPDLATTLQKYFGHAAFRGGQERVIEALLEGRSQSGGYLRARAVV